MPINFLALLALLMLSACTTVSLTDSTTNPTAPAMTGTTRSLLPDQVESLNGSRWSLVQIQSMDDSVYTPGDDARYTLEFLPQGRFSGQADCNRIQGGWAHTGKSQLVFSQIISTRALCPPESLSGRYLSDLEYTRSFVMQGGHLFLATMADGAILEFAPLPAADPAPAFDCSEAEGSVEDLLCEDAGLMALDLYMDELYQATLANFSENELPTLRAFQRGWISGRNECWKAAEMLECVINEYLTRASELEVRTGCLTVPEPVMFTCDDDTAISSYFYRDALLPLAVLNITPNSNQEQVFTWQSRSASGVRFTGRNIELWVKGNEATLTTLENVNSCQQG